MKLLIVINAVKHLGYYDYDLLRSHVGDCKFIAIMSHHNHDNLPQNIKQNFSNTYAVDLTSRMTDGRRTLDFEQAKHIIQNELENIDTVSDARIICIDPENILLASELREHFGIEGNKPKDLARFLDKALMKEIAHEAGIRVPKFLETHPDTVKENPEKFFDIFASTLGLPFILKPTQGVSSIGITKISDIQQLIEWARSDVFASMYEAEEFIEGELFHCDSLMYDSHILFQASSKYLHPNLDFIHGKPCSSIPLLEDSTTHKRLAEFTRQFLNALGIINGSNHTEVFITPGDELVLLETGPRPPGAHVIPCYTNTFGINFAMHDFFIEVGAPLPVKTQLGKYQFWASFPPKSGIVKNLIKPNLQCDHEMKTQVSIGDVLKNPKSLYDDIASISVSSSNYQELMSDFETLRDFSPIEIDKSPKKTLIFLNQRGHHFFNFEPYYHKNEYRFVAVLEKRFYQQLPEKQKKYFTKIYILEDQPSTKTVFLPLDYKTLEDIVAKELSAIDNHAERCHIICTDEFNMLIAGRLRDRYQIPGASYAACLLYRDKLLMKTVLEENKIRTPIFMHLNYQEALKNPEKTYKDITSQIASAFMIKPTSGAGSVGTAYIQTYDAFMKFIDMFQNEPVEFEVEEYIAGDIYHCDSIISDGEIITTFYSKYNRPCMDYNKGHVMGSIVLQDDNPIIPRLRNMVKQSLHALGLINGVTHMEVFHSSNDEIIFLEVAARPPGGLVISVYEKTFGISFYDAVLAIETETFEPFIPKKPQQYAFWLYFPSIKGKVISCDEPNITSEYTLTWNVKPGDIIESNAQSFLDTTGNMFAFNDNYDALYKDFVSLLTYKPVTFK